jgi:superfamily II RNA helicase
MNVVADNNFNPNEYFLFELSEFQCKAINAIYNEDHILVTAHTGSGKTVPAEFAIEYFIKKGLKVIYTGPIKALCNQKYHDFKTKFPHISFGILTGDIKHNPTADVLIMTTEILRNTLFKKKMQTDEKMPLMFEMDMDSELGAVVFDEVHYISDPERGAVWEQSILLLPPSVQLILLSATMDKINVFAKWIEDEKNKQCDITGDPYKKVQIASTDHRIVPLNHYMWLTMHDKQLNQLLKDGGANLPQLLEKAEGESRFPFVDIISPKGCFDEENYYKISKLKSIIDNRKAWVKRQQVLNQLIKQLLAKDMLPAIFFVFSKRNVEKCAKEIQISLFEKDDDTPNQIKKECDHLLRSKLSNHKEYMSLPEYNTLLPLLMKGIAIHHAGMMPILREMVEFLFEKKYIKVLFATETFAVGINMPAKTVVFTDISKFDGHGMRYLKGYEYTQMAGRAGRRGIDTVGHVIHCNNLFDMPTTSEYRKMLTGPPQALQSSFKISFHLVLNIIVTQFEQFQDTDFMKLLEQFVGMSLMNQDIMIELQQCEKEHQNISNLISAKKDILKMCKTSPETINKYYDLENGAMAGSQKARKRTLREMLAMKKTIPALEGDLQKYKELANLRSEKSYIVRHQSNTNNFIRNSILDVLNILMERGFIEYDNKHPSLKGIIAAGIQEMHPLIFADMYEISNGFGECDAIDLAGLFSCFSQIRVADDVKIYNPRTESVNLNMMLELLKDKHDAYQNLEDKHNIDNGQVYEINFDLIDSVKQWCKCTDYDECQKVLETIKNEKGLFTGEFIKTILKINNIATEISKLCEMVNNIRLLYKLQEIPKLTLKYIATNQSLYL